MCEDPFPDNKPVNEDSKVTNAKPKERPGIPFRPPFARKNISVQPVTPIKAIPAPVRKD